MWETNIQLSLGDGGGVMAEVNGEVKVGSGEHLMLDFTRSFCSVGNSGECAVGRISEVPS